MRRILWWAMTVVVGVLAVIGLWSASTAPPSTSVQERAREVSQSLRCPTCAGESIADSSALLSEAMRQTVEEQVRDGRSAQEIRGWFAERYGDEVLLAPPRDGPGWVLWAAPVLLVGAAVALLLARGGRARRRTGAGLVALAATVLAGAWLFGPQETGREVVRLDGPPRQEAPRADAVMVLRDAVDHAPGDAGLRLALAGALERAGDASRAVDEYAAAIRLRPLDADARYRYAFALVRSGDPETARQVLDETLQLRDDHAPSVLLLGVLLRDDDPGRAGQLLRRFVALEPEHPAAEQVTAFLQGGGDVTAGVLP